MIKLTRQGIADFFGIPFETVKSWFLRNEGSPKNRNDVFECIFYYKAKKDKKTHKLRKRG